MARSRSSSAWPVLWAGLVFLSFRPIAPVERALEVLLAPLRFAAELGSPLALLRARRVAAAERELAGAAHAEAAEGAETLARLAERALPSDPELRAGRRFLAGEVVERSGKDECWVALREPGVARGAPVVCGDTYVGRVLEVRAGEPIRARVQLVTAADFRVGAEVRGEEPIYLIVGGVRAPRTRGGPRRVELAVHQPSSNALAGGLARVYELLADADDSGGLAQGFRLGAVRREGERGECWIEPELDYLDGLFQVAIVAAEAEAARAAPPPARSLEDRSWLATRALSCGDPAPWRSTLKVPLGRAAGLRPGAAVTGAGARLIGRVCRAGLTTSDVALLSDPGFRVAAVARFEDGGEPRVLGRLTTLGRARDGAIRMRWSVRAPLDAGSGEGELLRARLFSGSGDPGLPGGLFLGSALLPARAQAGEELEIRLETEVDPADVRALWVRREDEGTRP